MSSSDSDQEQPVVKKKRATRIRRAETPTLEEDGDDDDGGLYGSKVKACMKLLNSGQINMAVIAAAEDGEHDVQSPLLPQKVAPSLRPKRHSSSDVNTPDVITLREEHDDSLNMSQERAIQRERSPTPPPATPVHLPSRKKRQTKKVRKAISELEQVAQLVPSQAASSDESDDDVVLLDDDLTTPSPEKAMPIRIHSRSGYQRFRLRRADTFADIFRQMALHEGVSEDKIVLYMKDRNIQPFDKPANINLGIADIIECVVMKASQQTELDRNDPNVVEISIQGRDPKSKTNYLVHKREPLTRVLKSFASSQSLNYSTATYQFDGEAISTSDSAGSLDMEEEDCIDVMHS